MTRYWFTKITDDSFFYFAVEQNLWMMQQQYNVQGNSGVTNMWESIRQIKEGDFLMLGYGNTIHAIGKIRKPRNIPEKHYVSNMAKTIKENKHEYKSGFVIYDDNDVFYENFTDFNGTWGQRIDVEKWEYYTETGISNTGIQDGSVNNRTIYTIFEIKEKYFNEKTNEIKNIYMENKIPIEVQVLYEYLWLDCAVNVIDSKIFGQTGHGVTSYNILKAYEVSTKSGNPDYKKGILKKITLDEEISKSNGKYLEALQLLKKYYPHLNTEIDLKRNIMPTNQENFAKNIILYGPPGTGKTYNSIDKSVEIAAPDKFKPNDHKANKAVFDELRKQGLIEFVTFHQNYSYEDFVVGITPDVTSGTLRFDKKEGIFKLLSERAKQNWLASTNNNNSIIDFNHVFNSFFSKLIEEEVNEVEIPMKRKDYKFKVTSIDFDYGRIKFTKQSGGTGHDMLLKNVKSIYEETNDYGNEGLGVYYNPLVDRLKEFAKEIEPQKSTNEPVKNFVLVIDEINRANISKVFGELITLLEADKRLGADNELKITLPNGEKEFGVPPNLFIIGTMNTADKSIALIDIALRRRFEFIGYYPKYEDYNADAITLLQKINSAIFEAKNKSADYLIGHAYFMNNQPIESVLKNKVVPLLMEYFSGKTEIVSGIFSETGWSVTYNTTNYSWDIKKK